MHPQIIQGGMGVGVSGWRLARAVSETGQLGVVSGTALDSVLVRRLQDGDQGGHVREAMAHFPNPKIAGRVLTRFFRPRGREDGQAYDLVPMDRPRNKVAKLQLIALSNFVEVFLAKQGHEGVVGINYLTKIHLPTLPALYGAMLAGVDYVLMGAGIPREVPGVLQELVEHKDVSIRLDASGTPTQSRLTFAPSALELPTLPQLRKPLFLPIVASNSLATMMARKATGPIDGFVVEGPTAGGHNAPPRGRLTVNDRGEPIYGKRDEVNLASIAELGLPFWCAGGAGRPGALQEAQAAGATGIQVGTLFAYCDESGLSTQLKQRVIQQSIQGAVDVLTDAAASPTGFPFKAVDLPGSVSADEVYQARERVCDLGYLRELVATEEGDLVLRCSAEPVDTFVKAGGALQDTVGRRCLCNALMANIGLGQVRGTDRIEPPYLTSGDDLTRLGAFLDSRTSYSAADVVAYLMA